MEENVGSMIVIQFVTLDGVTEDPDGSQGFEHGGWAFRFGPQAVAGDKFKMGQKLETGTLLLGRRTWELFSRIWPSRTDDFSAKMNRIQKLVASKTRERVDEWSNSVLLKGDLIGEIKKHKNRQDVIVIGSDSLVQTLIQQDLVDEYRLLIFPVVLGEGRRLFKDGIGSINLRLVTVEQSGEAVLATYRRDASEAH
jgi:dihydrofolate reductase